MSDTLLKISLAENLATSYQFDPFGISRESPLGDFERSLRKIGGRIGETNVFRRIEKLGELAGNDPYRLFPTREEILTELLPLLHSMQTAFPFCRTGLSISSPVAAPDNISFNMIIRLYKKTRQLGIKIKIGVFCDQYGDLYYEVGYVDLSKSLFHLEKNFLSTTPSKGDYNTLCQLVNCTKSIIRRRSLLKGLDLTPAYYHVLPLCLRLGGQPADLHAYQIWITETEKAAAYSLELFKQRDPGFYSKCRTIHQRFIISWLFQNNLIFGPCTGEQLNWSPHRLLWAADR